MSIVPKLEEKDAGIMLKEIKDLAKSYTPEWNFDENSEDFGVVFAKLFAKMQESTVSRYNKTLYNYYLTFLNMLGTKLRPAAPAEGMIIIKSNSKNNGIYIEKGTQIYAEADTPEGTALYETTDSLTAINSGIKDIIFAQKNPDIISYVYNQEKDNEENSIGPIRLFDNVFGSNLQKYELYFYDDVIFDMSSTDITFSFFNSYSEKGQKELPKVFSDIENISWQYFDGTDWKDVDNFEESENGVRITFQGKTEKTTIGDKEARYLRCIFKSLPAAGIKVTKIKYKSSAETVKADGMFSETTELSKMDFYPFGEQYTLYGSFSFCCDEALSKKGANIDVSLQMQFTKIKVDYKVQTRQYRMIMTDLDFEDLQPGDIEIEKVIWEYWNGRGWAKLPCDRESEDIFKLKSEKAVVQNLRFKCPEDIESISIGSREGYFIRARISRIANQFDVMANYITPYIHEITVKYDYENNGEEAKEIYSKADLSGKFIELSNFYDQINILNTEICDFPSIYLCLSQPLSKGMVRIFFDIEESANRFAPAVKWEYLAEHNDDKYYWKHIDVLDATEGFSHSETVALIGKEDFKKGEIFGKKGYFIRISNPDKSYKNTENIAQRPVIKDIRFNAVKIMQKNRRPSEYFSIEKDEENKICKLSYPNVGKIEVWVDEFGKISTNEQENFLKMSRGKVQPEYDAIGTLEKLWIKWESVANLVSTGMNDRVYEVNYPDGEILFGNGRHGKIPPTQQSESIRIDYSACEGTKGNVGNRKVIDFVESIQEIEKVHNPEPVMGGVDMETIDVAAKRIFSQLSGGSRLVSADDFEKTISFNDRNIYKVKCISHVDENSEPLIGVTSIAVLPYNFLQGYEKFQGIKRRILQLLDESSAAIFANSNKMRVFEVSYVEASVAVEVIINDFNAYQSVHKEIEERLKEFLNPITGNFSRRGWEIGEFLRKEFIYNYIKTIPNVRYIKNINIFTKLITPEGKKEVDFEKVKKLKFVVPVYGEPQIEISVN